MANVNLMVQTNTYLDNLNREYPDINPIVLLHMWDMIRDYYLELENNPGDTEYGEYELVPGMNLEKIWDTFHKDPFGGFDYLTEDVVEWLSANGLIQFVEDGD
jgi:hypothetical protein